MKRNFSEKKWLDLALSVGVLAAAIGLSLFAYLGTFSRYTSDDYCLSAFFTRNNLIDEMTRRYFVASSRYTNILFIGLVDKILGWYNVAILPALMAALFVWGLYLLLKEIDQILELRLSRLLILFAALSIAYFSILQAPNLYETLYWRAGMTSHFAPLVFIPFFGAFLLRQIRCAEERPPSLWIYGVCFTAPLMIGGLSEPPTAFMITILSLGIFATLWWKKGQSRRFVLILLSWSLAGALMSLVVLALAPANSLRLQTPPPGLVELALRIFTFPWEFIADTLRTLPTPTLITIAIPATLFYAKFSDPSQNISNQTRNRLLFLSIAVPLFAYLLIAASFAPSAYGQSYPVARSRFIGRLLMTTALMLEGALFATLLAQIKTKIFESVYVQRLALIVFILLALYPLRAALQISTQIPAFQQRAVAWDKRDSEIRALKVEGVRDLIVQFLPDDKIQDLGDRTEFRLNRCAAALYGVDSILALPVEDE
jgi:hypothetical protein